MRVLFLLTVGIMGMALFSAMFLPGGLEELLLGGLAR